MWGLAMWGWRRETLGALPEEESDFRLFRLLLLSISGAIGVCRLREQGGALATLEGRECVGMVECVRVGGRGARA